MSAWCEETPAVHGSGETVETKLHRIAEKARKEPQFKFTSLYHLMNEEHLRECFKRLRKDAAAGIDKMTKEKYAENLDSNLSNRTEGLPRMAYRPQPVRRKYIPKPGSDKQRPLGIPCFEDKLVQAGLVRILEAVYEQDFIGDSYGYRPKRNCHQALRALSESVEKGGRITVSDEGTPQGGVISPLLANIYLHYALDLWFEKVFRKRCTGQARLIRVADEFIGCFQDKADADEFQRELNERLGKFGLEVEPTKTRVVEFGRFAARNAKERGERPKTFDLLGFTHYCGTRRDGKGFRMKRVTARKKFTAKVKAFKEWLMKARTMKTKELWEAAKAKLRGHYAYYGVSDNLAGIKRFAREAEKLLYKWLNRRGKRQSLSWEKFYEMLKRFPLPEPRIKVSMFGKSVN